MNESTIYAKSEAFALRIIKLYNYLCKEHKEFVFSKQLLRCGTSIGANIAEAQCGISSKDFLAKMYIAFKEASETRYWLTLLYKSNYLKREYYDSILKDCDELFRMLSSLTKTLKENS